MTDEFKRKLEAYQKGQLSEEDTQQIEQELEKLAIVQTILEEQLDTRPINAAERSVSYLDEHEQRRIIRRGKWKARLQNTGVTAILLYVIGLCMTIVTSVFYSWGEPDRSDIYRNVVASTIAITEPNVTFRSSFIEQNLFFSMTLEGDLEKHVGGERQIPYGTLSMKFFFNRASYPEWKVVSESADRPSFYYPGSAPHSDDAWYRLERLPEGTVAEAYVSLDRLYPIDELLQLLKTAELEPIWYAVDTGFDQPKAGEPLSTYDPIGFPHDPVWHHDDFTVTERTEEASGWFGKTVQEVAESPALEQYGSDELRHDNFIKALELLADYEHIAKQVSTNWDLNVHERLAYVEEHGINIYGVVITGPTKQLLTLQDAPWVAGLQVGEVRLWNWSKPEPTSGTK